MSINLDPTPENEALAAAVQARMAADGRIVNARAALLRLAGVAGLVVAVGVSAAAAMFGYSLIKDERSSADKIADAIVRALDRTTLKTSGEVRLADDARVRLESQPLTLDPNAAMRIEGPVKLDPEATVKLDPGARGPAPRPGAETARPTAEQLQRDAKPPSGVSAVTNYTVFKSVRFGQGSVVTGWSFNSSEQTKPSTQYCYYVQGVGEVDSNAQVKVDVAVNGVMLPNLKPRNFDPAAAAAACTWFEGGATRTL